MKKNTMYCIIFILSLALITGLASSCITIQDEQPGKEQTAPRSTSKASAPVVNSFTANPDNMTKGQSVYLNWDVSGAAEVTIDPVVGDVDPVSTVLISPESTTTYTLTAHNDAGSATAVVTVTVASAAIGKPDLVITDVWVQVDTIYYKIKNIGNEPAPGSRTYLYVNEVKRVETDDYAEPLAPGEERTESFGRYEWDSGGLDTRDSDYLPGDAWGWETLPKQATLRACANAEHSIVESNEDNNCLMTIQGDKVTYNFNDAAHIAIWTTGAGKLGWPVPESKTGSAFFKESITMEDGRGHASALATYPEQVNNGWIQGVFSGFYTEPKSLALMRRGVKIPRMAKFTAEVGLKKGATETDGVRFKFGIIDESGVVQFFPGIFAEYDEKLDLYEVDLSALADKKVSFILRVEDGEGNLYLQNNAVWIDPKVTQELQ
jgi:hypothetical protein